MATLFNGERNLALGLSRTQKTAPWKGKRFVTGVAIGPATKKLRSSLGGGGLLLEVLASLLYVLVELPVAGVLVAFAIRHERSVAH